MALWDKVKRGFSAMSEIMFLLINQNEGVSLIKNSRRHLKDSTPSNAGLQ